MSRAPLLVLGVGNPSRGDDALGPLFVERLASRLAAEVEAGEVELLTDFQLQVEHALDLEGRERVLFVDASVSAPAPFSFLRLEARRDASATSHAMSAAAVLEAAERLGIEVAACWQLGIRAERFDLGAPLSDAAEAHLSAALGFAIAWVAGEGGRAGRRFELEGTVQGVGFRPWLVREAAVLGLGGRVFNTTRGVTIEAFGERAALDSLRVAFATRLPPAARVEAARETPLPFEEGHGRMVIASSVGGGATRMALPPDLAACPRCLAEVDDPRDRHFGYVFTSCTDCGPRLSVALELPYDRPATTMAQFGMCHECASEYARIEDRRFHAQTVACPACGPRLWLADRDGRELTTDDGDAVAAAARRLEAGEIVAIQGHGAFHLACDATRAEVVAELRRRKRRELRPFAVMVPDLAMAEALAVLDADTRLALTSVVRPIVLAPAKPTAGLAPERPGAALAPGVNGPSSKVGVMLPSTPLQHRLLGLLRRPLVMTSGNLAGHPVAIEHEAALRTLGPVADAFLLHDRPTARRVEDSIVTRGAGHGAGGVRVLRRARGLAPDAIRLPRAAPEPILAVGGHLKNTVCVVVEDRAYLSPHLGDLDTVEGEEAWRVDLSNFERLLGVSPEVVAHDLHPGYATTRLAEARPARLRLGVQHHLAHVLAAVAELHLHEPVVGLAFDGTGHGLDGTAWGGEVLLVDGARWWRLAALRPLPLPGGEAAIRQPWRQALAALHLAFGPEAEALALRFPALAEVPAGTRAGVMKMLAGGLECAPARGLGRWFDAVGALALGIGRAGFEGHVAIALEDALGSAPGEVDPYRIELEALREPVAPTEVPLEVDLAPVVRQVVADLLEGRSPGHVAARFHQTIAHASARLCDEAVALTGARLVVPTGGSFQNAALLSALGAKVGLERLRVPRAVPVNDGGIALGQAYLAVLHSGGG